MTTITQQARDIAADVLEANKYSAKALAVRSSTDNDGTLALFAMIAQCALDAPRPAMSEAEMWARARAAARSVEPGAPTPEGRVDAAFAALRDLDKPIAVDPVVLACREIVAQENATSSLADEVREGLHDSKPMMRTTMAAYRAGQAAGQ